jgi:hypothetical protein
LYQAYQANYTHLANYLLDNSATFGQDIEDIYNLFKQSSQHIRQQLQEYIESDTDDDDSSQYFPITNVIYFNEILSLKTIPDKYNFFKSDEFKEKLLDDVINQLTEENCEYKGKLLFYMKGLESVKQKIRNNLKLLQIPRILEYSQYADCKEQRGTSEETLI